METMTKNTLLPPIIFVYLKIMWPTISCNWKYVTWLHEFVTKLCAGNVMTKLYKMIKQNSKQKKKANFATGIKHQYWFTLPLVTTLAWFAFASISFLSVCSTFISISGFCSTKYCHLLNTWCHFIYGIFHCAWLEF